MRSERRRHHDRPYPREYDLLLGGSKGTQRTDISKARTILEDLRRTGELDTSLIRWDAADYLDDDAAIIAYLNEAAAQGDPKLLHSAISPAPRA